jgi:hypothetical protein
MLNEKKYNIRSNINCDWLNQTRKKERQKDRKKERKKERKKDRKKEKFYI